MGTPLFIVATLCILLCKIVESQGASEYAVLKAISTKKLGAGNELSLCVVFNNRFQSLPSDIKKAHFHKLVDLSHIEACAAKDLNDSSIFLKNNVVAVARGKCTFVQKAHVVQSFNGAGVLIVDYKNATRPTFPGGNLTEFNSLNITIATIGFEDYTSLLSLSKPVAVAFYAPSSPLWDPNMILIILLSTFLVVTGAAWAACDERQLQRRNRNRPTYVHDAPSGDGSETTDPEITIITVMVWFILICSMIMLLYFFYDYMVYFFIAAFCLSGTYSLYHCLLPIWSWFMPVIYDIPVDRLPCINSKVKLRSFILLLLCVTLDIFWVIERQAKFAWIIQDLLGAAFCIFFIHTLHLPNLMIIAIFLMLLLIYDVFFVFITPLFTSDGSSVMESVATGDRGRSKESLPMVFLIPTLFDFPIKKCMGRDFSILGFGDVIIPGLLVSYNSIFDVTTGNRMVYCISSSIGYFIGMIVCIISLVYMNSGQPALLYLVPCTLFITFAVALVRKEFCKLFFGLHKQKSESNDHIESTAREVEEGDVNNDCTDEEEKNLIK